MGLSWQLETFFEHRDEDCSRGTIVAEPAFRRARSPLAFLRHGEGCAGAAS